MPAFRRPALPVRASWPARRQALALLMAGAAGAAHAEGAGLMGLMRRLRGSQGGEGELDRDDDAPGGVVLPAGARSELNLAYGDDPAQKLDVFIPAAGGERRPVLLMVHGGAWMVGDKANRGVAAAKVARWLPRGWIVVSTNYRMDRQAPNPLQQADDVARALAFVQQKAAGWGGDGERVLLMGHSAGAHLVALLAADARIAERRGARPWLGTVALDSAALDVVQIMEGSHYRFYDRVFGKDPAVWRDNSPYHRLAGTPRPMLLVCSSQRKESCGQAERFAAKVQAAGARAQVLPVDFNHGGINAELGKDTRYTEQVEAFMKSLGLP
ncbi:acetyl esterase/lipase [Rubrivivax gelatinosus]|uniref:alpha/beta hydrolase n=2 Tax=Rubrivivax gelatinosus TaxID=28068 RepID=UPI0018C93F39|nr:alpha/beta hydrolase [Rubrivivax gelatinosus]MBG6078468.1 acetyl esterase/lipase [Rubrivivax gelatinosus]